MIDNLLDYDRSVYLYYFLSEDFNLYNFRHLDSSLDYLLNNLRYFHNPLLHFFHLHNLLNYPIHVFDHFNRHMNDFLNLLYFGIRHHFLHYLLNWDNRRHLDYSLHNFLDYFGHLHNLLVDVEALQNILNIYAILSLLIDHGNYSFIDLRGIASLVFDLLELFQKIAQ